MTIRSLVALGTLISATAISAPDHLEKSKAAILKMTGCFLVDYSYAETEALKPGYQLDSRVYDVNRDKSVKEWIFPIEVSDTKLRLQHILFFADKAGKVSTESIMKHQAEDWEYEPRHWYEFTGPGRWEPRAVQPNGAWVRRITNLDDGLRYQCVSPWRHDTGYPEWSCRNYAPIPGRETRDMGRKDYQTLDRDTRLVIYGGSWLERQDNVKTIHNAAGRAPLAKELGKNWYVRLPDAECSEAAAWAKPRAPFAELLRETWEEVLDGKSAFLEQTPAGQMPRFMKMYGIEAKYLHQVEHDAAARARARREILDLIAEYRK